jgi:hypothetical protein
MHRRQHVPRRVKYPDDVVSQGVASPADADEEAPAGEASRSGAEGLITATDVAAQVLLAAVAVMFVASLVGGLANGYPGIGGWYRVQVVTSWAGVVTSCLVLASLGLVVLPRMIWGDGGDEERPRRARRLIIAAVVNGAVVAVAACLCVASSIVAQGLQAEVVSVYGQYSASVLLSAASVVLAWRSLAYWPAPPRLASEDEELDIGDEEV